MPKRQSPENSFATSSSGSKVPPKKKTTKKATPEAKRDATIMFYVPESLKRDLKAYAANNGKSMKDLLREMIEEKIYQ